MVYPPSFLLGHRRKRRRCLIIIYPPPINLRRGNSSGPEGSTLSPMRPKESAAPQSGTTINKSRAERFGSLDWAGDPHDLAGSCWVLSAALSAGQVVLPTGWTE